MNEAVFNLLMTVLTAAVTAVSAYGIAFIKKKGEQAAAQTDSIKRQDAIEEITAAISTAVSATSQTYVDALKAAGSFDAEAQKQALMMSLTACIKALSPATKTFIELAYGDLTEYLTGCIEAEVRKQKKALPASTTASKEDAAETTTVAASTAAATAAAVVQNAIAKTSEK
jgi:hypothetical protein